MPYTDYERRMMQDERQAFAAIDPRPILDRLGIPRNPKERHHPGRDIYTWNGNSIWVHEHTEKPGIWMITDHHHKGAIGGKNAGTILDFMTDYVGGNPGEARKLLRLLTGIHKYNPFGPPPGPRTAAAHRIVSGPASPTIRPARLPRETAANATDAVRTPAPVLALAPAPAVPVYPLAPEFYAADKKSPEEILREYELDSVLWNPDTHIPRYLRLRGLFQLDPVWSGSFRVGEFHDEIRFPFSAIDENGRPELGGVEQQNRFQRSDGSLTDPFVHYSDGGRVGIWTGGWADATRLVVVESPIDAISRSISRDEQARYIAVREKGEDTAARYINRLAAGGAISEVVLACNNDLQGARYHTAIWAQLGSETKTSEDDTPPKVCVRADPPPIRWRDWNDTLTGKTRTPEGAVLLSKIQEKHRAAVAAYRGTIRAA